MLNILLFFLVIFLSNIVQGITGFAGTVLAMPFGLMLVGYATAKPVLNVLGLCSGIYIFAGNIRYVRFRELKRILLFMIPGILAGMLIRPEISGNTKLLYLLLSVFVLMIAARGLLKSLGLLQNRKKEDAADVSRKIQDTVMLGLAGLVHGIFVTGGPVLIGYLSKRIPEKNSFRASISAVWIVLNFLILLDDIHAGFWVGSLLPTFLLSVPVLLLGMWIGSLLVKRMSQKFFLNLTYLLLFFSGISLLLKSW